VHLSGDIYEYYWILQTGPGQYDQVGVHRVVEERNGQPISSKQAIFMLPGDNGQFDDGFVAGTQPSDGIAIYLASRGIDVWGIDYDWEMVPLATTDLTFMQDWGLQHEVNDVETSISFARSVRVQTGSPGNAVTLLAWSRGGWIGYALLNDESQMPAANRQVSAYIPVDTMFKTNSWWTQFWQCNFETSDNANNAAGIYGYPNTGGAPSFPGLTTQQALLLVGAALYQLGPSGASPFFHYVAGIFPQADPWALPTGLVYTDLSRFTSFWEEPGGVEPSKLEAETEGITCGDSTTGLDTHLDDIHVPVLYVGAGGGFGPTGVYTLSLLGSKDVQTKIISFRPADQAGLDFGHIDLFLARNADHLVWEPIFNWLSQEARQEH